MKMQVVFLGLSLMFGWVQPAWSQAKVEMPDGAALPKEAAKGPGGARVLVWVAHQ